MVIDVDKTYQFTSLKKFKRTVLNRGTFIGLFGVSHIPHLGIISNGKYYSVGANKVKLGASVDVLVHSLIKKNIPTVFVKLSNDFSERELIDVYSRYTHGLADNNTCIQPIKEVVGVHHKGEMIISDLLYLLEEASQIEAFYGLNIVNEIISLHTYTRDDILQYIQKIKK